MRSHTLIILMLLLLASNKSYGQFFFAKESDSLEIEAFFDDGNYKTIRNSLVLRKSAPTYFSDGDSKLAQKGALIAFTLPKDKEESYAINAGLIFGFNSVIQNSKKKVLFTQWAILPYIQFDKNTLIDKEQSNLLTGVSYATNTINFHKVRDAKKFNLVSKVQVSYRDDYENDLQALQTSLTFLPQQVAISKKKDKEEGKLKRVSWINEIFDVDFVAGFEYDYRYNSDSALLDGNMFRTYSKAIAQLKTKEGCLSTALEWEYRYVLANSTDLDEDDFSLLTLKLNYKFKNSIGGSRFENNIESMISIIHQNGSNPTNGFNDQAYWALALELKI